MLHGGATTRRKGGLEEDFKINQTEGVGQREASRIQEHFRKVDRYRSGAKETSVATGVGSVT
ncbi:hypothetical protein, partial [Streptomyces parvus]|uniref:hypothetical protein n=1 Tax=Streptomyces parvus TaxID=66428 RepID=UPI0033D6C174